MSKTLEQLSQLKKIDKQKDTETQTIEKMDLNLTEENKKDWGEQEEKVKEQEQEQIESVREQIENKQEKDDSEKDMDLIKRLRLPRNFDSRPIELTTEKKVLISDMAKNSENRLEKNYTSGFGISPTSNPEEQFTNQIWTRDLGHAAGNYFVYKKPEAISDSFKTIFKHQREDGMLPFRVEKTYGPPLGAFMNGIPGIRSLKQPLFNLMQKRIRGRDERPRYEGQSASAAQDIVPTTIIALGEFYINSAEGKKFVKDNYEQIKKAVDFFRTKSDPEDDLISVRKGNADWADSIMRAGKLGNINVWWARSLRMMEFMANDMDQKEDAKKYKEEFHKVKNGVMEKLHNKEGGYFRAEKGKDRVDTAATIFGSLFFLNPAEAAKAQKTLKSRMDTPLGLKNFDPPYPEKEIDWKQRAIGHGGYHNKYIWPWLTLQNIQVKIKIALQHPDENIRNQYKEEAVGDLVRMSKLFNETGGAYETYDPKTGKPAISKMLSILPTQQSQKNIMGNMAAYQGAYNQLKELGWI